MGLTNVLVVTNRPAIADSWYDDYLKFVGTDNYLFVSHVGQLLNRQQPCLTRRQYLEHVKRSKEVVRSGFMSNFLFDNISNVYGCSTAVIDIINQFPATKAPKDSEVNADDVEELSHNVDADGQPQTDADKVKAVQDSLFGEKIYADTGKTIDDFVHETIERHNEEKRKRGKSAEEQLIDEVSSRLSTLLIGQAKQNDGNALTLSKRNEGALPCASSNMSRRNSTRFVTVPKSRRNPLTIS